MLNSKTYLTWILVFILSLFITSCGGGNGSGSTPASTSSEPELIVKEVRGLVKSNNPFYQILGHPTKNAVFLNSSLITEVERIMEDVGVWFERGSTNAPYAVVAIGEQFIGFPDNPTGQFTYTGNMAIRQRGSTYDGPIQMIANFNNNSIEISGATDDEGRYSYTIDSTKSNLRFEIETGEIIGEMYLNREGEGSHQIQGQPVTHGNWADLVGYFHGDGSEASGVFSSEELHLDGYITATKN